MKRLNPYYRKQWNEDRKLGPTHEDRIAEVRGLGPKLQKMSEEEQNQWIDSLDKIIRNDPSPEMRRFAVMALKDLDNPRAIEPIKKAAFDKSEKVQMAACDSLGSRKETDALDTLGQLAGKSKSTSVRVAAIQNIGNFPADQIKPVMTNLIADRSPAIQYECTVALGKSTKMELGGDVAEWKRYLAGEPVEPKTKTVAATLSDLNPLKR
jgi:HEAT repeat protein